MERPVMVLTMGDAAGVGPELIVKVLAQEETYRRCRPLVIAGAGVIQQACRLLGVERAVREVSAPAKATFAADGIDVLGGPELDVGVVEMGRLEPRLAVAALNVHAGEGGLFGREEIEVIEPAVVEAQRSGLAVTGPVPADTVFVRARAGEFQGVVCMYHDQANIARKLLATRRGATVFLGLPVPCATTAHGTAYDIAGKGVAAPGSLADALGYTSSLAGGGAG